MSDALRKHEDAFFHGCIIGRRALAVLCKYFVLLKRSRICRPSFIKENEDNKSLAMGGGGGRGSGIDSNRNNNNNGVDSNLSNIHKNDNDNNRSKIHSNNFNNE